MSPGAALPHGCLYLEQLVDNQRVENLQQI
jgi:hypothetical protein